MRRKKKLDISLICNKQNKKIKISYYKLFIYLDKYNISRCDFCDLCNISRQTLERLRHSENISWTTIVKILNALHKIDNKKHYLEDIIDIEYYW